MKRKLQTMRIKFQKKQIMRKKLWIICFIAVLALSVCHTTDVKAALKDDAWDYGKKITKTESGFQYLAHPSKDGKEAWIYVVLGNFHKRNITLSIPKTIDGRKVTRLGEARRTQDYPLNIIGGSMNGVKKVILPDTIEVIQPYTFAEMEKLESIKIPKNVTKIKDSTFYGCKRLKKVILPEKLKKIDPMAFYKCPNLKKLAISSKNNTFKLRDKFLIRRKDNALIFATAGGTTLKIPGGVKSIKQNACNNVTASTVHIPASVLKMEEDALTSEDIKNVTIAVENKTFQKDGQCIYRKKDKSLAVAIADENRNLCISENIEKITMEYSMVNYERQEPDCLQSVIFPKNLKSVKYPGFSRIANTKLVYFTGAVPPKLTVQKKDKWMGLAKLPIFCDLYVPKASIKSYKAWYKKYDEKDDVKWHTSE